VAVGVVLASEGIQKLLYQRGLVEADVHGTNVTTLAVLAGNGQSCLGVSSMSK
jgi:hypothetical protein